MGLFDALERYYTKEGKGIYKNAPQKKSAFRTFFEILGTKWTSLLRANLMYVLLCLPLVTNGLATMGLTYVTRNAARRKFAYPVADFFSTVRRTWRKALPVGIINLLVWSLLGFNTYFYVASLFFRTDGSQAPDMHWFMLALNLVGLLMFTFMNYYIPFMVITFDLKIKQMYKNAFMFALHNFKANLGIFGMLFVLVAVLAVPMLLADYRIWGIVLLLLYVLLYPAVRSLLIQFVTFPYMKKVMIDPYYEAHPDADRKALRLLNLDDEIEEPVFEDRAMDDIRVSSGKHEDEEA